MTTNPPVKERKVWINGKERRNKSDQLGIVYEVGEIYIQGTFNKTVGKLVRFFKGIAQNLTFGFYTPNEMNTAQWSNFQTNGEGYTEGTPLSEFFVFDPRKNSSDWDKQNAVKLVGCYIYPAFSKYTRTRKTNDPRYNQHNKKFEVDTHNLPAHYLKTHCYYNFKIHGEDFAKIWGIEKISGGDGAYGFHFSVVFDHYVGFRMYLVIAYGQHKEELTYESMLKEDLCQTDSAQIAKWAAQAIGTIAIGAATAGAGLTAASAAGAVKVGGAVAKGVEMSQKTYSDSGRKFGWKEVDTLRVEKAQAEADEMMSKATAKGNLTMGKAVGRSFSTIGRIFWGGRATYSASICEFIKKKATFDNLFVECRTSQYYQDLWHMEMNRRIIQDDFWFGTDPEIALKKDFGMCSGKGYDEKKNEGVLRDLHGWIQLSPNSVFLAKENPLLNRWIEDDIFVYQLRESKRPKKEFFEGFKGELFFEINQPGGTIVENIERKEQRLVSYVNQVSEAVVFGYYWVPNWTASTGLDPSGFSVSNEGSSTGSGNKLRRYTGGTNCSTYDTLSWSGYEHLKDKSYKKVGNFNSVKVGNEICLGTGKYLLTKFSKLDTGEEELYEGSEDCKWYLKKVPGGTYGGNTIMVEGRGTELISIIQKVELNYSGLNLQWTVPLQGFSGIEGWGNNPPDNLGGSGGGGGLPITTPMPAQTIASGGMTLPDTNPMGISQASIPTEITSMVNTEQTFVPLELPQLDNPLAQMNRNQEFLQNNIGQQQQTHESLHSQMNNQRQKDKEKLKGQ